MKTILTNFFAILNAQGINLRFLAITKQEEKKVTSLLYQVCEGIKILGGLTNEGEFIYFEDWDCFVPNFIGYVPIRKYAANELPTMLEKLLPILKEEDKIGKLIPYEYPEALALIESVGLGLEFNESGNDKGFFIRDLQKAPLPSVEEVQDYPFESPLNAIEYLMGFSAYFDGMKHEEV